MPSNRIAFLLGLGIGFQVAGCAVVFLLCTEHGLTAAFQKADSGDPILLSSLQCIVEGP
jgi:hypothetical protein